MKTALLIGIFVFAVISCTINVYHFTTSIVACLP